MAQEAFQHHFYKLGATTIKVLLLASSTVVRIELLQHYSEYSSTVIRWLAS
jgi:hypothetical protein